MNSHSNRWEWMADFRGKPSWWSFCISSRQSSRHDLSLESVSSVLQRSGEHLEKRKIYCDFLGLQHYATSSGAIWFDRWELWCMYWKPEVQTFCAHGKFQQHSDQPCEWGGWIHQSLILWQEAALPLCCVCRTWNAPLKQPLLVWMCWVGNSITGMELGLAKS